MAQPVEHHDIDTIWKEIKSLERGYSEISSITSGMKSAMDAFGTQMEDIKDALSALSNKPQEKTNWVGIATMTLGMFALAGALVASTVSPISATVAKHDYQMTKELESSAEHRYNAGVRDGKLESMETVLTKFIDDTQSRLLANEKTVYAIEAKQDMLAIQVQAVDHLGSRKHVISAPKALEIVESEIKR